MNFDKEHIRMYLLFLVAGIVLGWLFAPGSGDTGKKAGKGEPLYWVAPMDPDYRRDGPGKSPMGMDLVPVYEGDGGAGDSSTRISPAVVNNLGVRTEKAAYRSLHPALRTVGYVKYDEDKLIHIHPRIEGWIETLYVKASGDEVKKGDPLYALYSPQLVNAQEEFLSALSRGNNSLVQAAEARLKSLQLSSSFITQLKKSRKVHQTVIFETPQTGVVDNLNIREGFYVKPGTTLMSVGSLDEVWVEAEIFERQASLVREGLEVEMTLDFLPGRKWSGVVDYVYPTLDAATRTVRVRLRFANPDFVLKPNMFSQVVIYADTAEERVTVPREAVIRTGEQNRVVLALGAGRFKSVAVSLGEMDDEYVSIVNGVQAGDEIVTSAQFLIDSESSKSSDFMRMSGKGVPAHEKVQSAETKGIINSVDTETRTANISREAIEKWGRPAATMDFVVGKSIELAKMEAGKGVAFRFEVSGGKFTIVELLDDEPAMEHAHD